MRIAQVSPLHESVPPSLYGGTERVVANLTESLVRLGHQVTLFASGDSRTSARLIAPCSRALRLAGTRDSIPQHVLMLEMVMAHQDEFDILHFHCDAIHLPLARRARGPSVTTVHGRLDLPALVPLYAEFRDLPLVSISTAQRRPIPHAGWVATVHHGLPPGLLRFTPDPGRRPYLAFAGRLSREKQPHVAVEIARRAGMELRIAAKMDPVDGEYIEGVLRPLLNAPGVTYLGEIGDGDKSDFLGNALALLFPIDWPEPFGLVMIEAMACGTPVIAFPCGSVPEIIRDGVTGMVVHDIDQAVRAVRDVARGRIDRRQCRREFLDRFSDSRMAQDYLRVYRRLIQADVQAHAPGRHTLPALRAPAPGRAPRAPRDRRGHVGTDHGRDPFI